MTLSNPTKRGRSRFAGSAPTRSGMTLIELVVAALLTAIMMVVLTNILWSTTRQTVAIRGSDSATASPKIMVDQLRRDLLNARGYSIGRGRWQLAGFVGSGQTIGQVIYQVDLVNGRRCLRRNGELVWIDLGEFRLTPLSFRDPDDDRPPLEGGGILPEMPALIQVSMTHRDGTILWNERIEHHDL